MEKVGACQQGEKHNSHAEDIGLEGEWAASQDFRVDIPRSAALVLNQLVLAAMTRHAKVCQ